MIDLSNLAVAYAAFCALSVLTPIVALLALGVIISGAMATHYVFVFITPACERVLNLPWWKANVVLLVLFVLVAFARHLRVF
jgi:hypothetical protein